MRLLIIEDELRTADYLQQGLRENGYVVDCAHTGTDGLHLARQQAYDLVILDVNLPEIDGWTVLQRLRAESATRIMMLTAHGRLADRVKGLDLGADDYLLKPFEFPELLARIRSCYAATTSNCSPAPCASLTWNWTPAATAPTAPGSAST